jgi:2-polyprenyl-6-methoxyphenol hydroxylase-like FAD-dependent oxidoreductase
MTDSPNAAPLPPVADPSPEAIASSRQARCTIVGGGPAGLMLGLVLARCGVKTVLLESHHDFDRDFRGDTVHPGTLEILAQLGLADAIHVLPHGKLRHLRLKTPSETITIADLGRLWTRYPYVMTLPQVHLLELLAAEARAESNFELILGANVQRLIRTGDAVEGIVYRDTANRWHEVRSALTVAADGRFSTVRRLAGIEPVRTSPPMDVLWFRLPKAEGDPTDEADIHVGRGRLAVMLDRGDEWQIGYVILKGHFGEVKAAGIEALQQGLAETVPMLAGRAHLVSDWKQVAVLSVESSRCQTWHQPGLLLIGDAAHAISPVGGVGINYAVQDAIVAANLLAEKLRGTGPIAESNLAAVQSRRERPVRFIQRVQRVIQDRVAAPGLDATHDFRPPWFLRMITRVPGVRCIPAEILAFGLRRVRLSKEVLAMMPVRPAPLMTSSS